MPKQIKGVPQALPTGIDISARDYGEITLPLWKLFDLMLARFRPQGEKNHTLAMILWVQSCGTAGPSWHWG
ncbi:MAG: hypothetical protein AB7G11_06490 [Phycisphaerales bacterium]